MTRRRTAYERSEAVRAGGPVLCVPRIIRYGADHLRSWIHVWDGVREFEIITGYCRRPDGMVLAIPMERCGDFRDHLGRGREAPWERVPVAVQHHILHEIAELEA